MSEKIMKTLTLNANRVLDLVALQAFGKCIKIIASAIFLCWITLLSAQGQGSPATSASGSFTISGAEQNATTGSSTSGTGSVTVSGSEQSWQTQTAAATQSSATVTITGSLQSTQVQTQPGTPGTGTIIVNGDEQTTDPCAQHGVGSCPLYDSGNISVTVGSYTTSVSYGQSDSQQTVASSLASALSSGPFTATVSGNVITVTSRTSGANTNYSISIGVTSYDNRDFSLPSFYFSASNLTGGKDPLHTTVYDSGSTTITVNGQAISYSWSGSATTTASIVQGLISNISSQSSYVTATLSGTAILLQSKSSGSTVNYSLSSSSSYDTAHFSSASFNTSNSGSAMTGGADAQNTTNYDSGTTSITANGHFTSYNWSGASTTPTSIASGLTQAINQDGSAFVNASASGAIINLTARTSGPSSNYTFSTSTTSSRSSFSSSASGSTLTGGSSASPTYDTGTVSITINGTTVQSSYSSSSTAASIASDLESKLPTSLVTATVSGATVNLTTVQTGSSANYPMSGSSSTSQPGTFSSPSFSISLSGSTLTGGTDAVTGPSITSLSPISGPVGTSVTISGSSFGSTQGTSTVTFNGVATTPTSWSATSIVAPVPAGASTGNVVVTVGGQTVNQSVVQSPGQVFFGTATLSLTVASSTSGNTLILLPGVPDGTTVTSVTDNKSNSWTQVPNAQATSAGDGYASDIWYCANCTGGVTTITAHLSASASFAALMAYEVSGIISTSPLELGAHASEGTVSGGNCTGPSVTTSFTDFLIAQGDADHGYSGVSIPWVFGVGQQEAYILNAAPGTYQPVFQAGSGSTHCLESLAAFKVITGTSGVASNPKNFQVGGGGGLSGAPSITSLSPISGLVGTSVTITGSNFGSTQGTSTVTFNGTNAMPTSWTNTSIVVPVPGGATTGNVNVTVAGHSSSGSVVQVVGQVFTGTPLPAVTINSSVAGNTLILLPLLPGGITVSSVTDNVGNNWVQVPNAQAVWTGEVGSDIWYCPNCGGGVTVIAAHLSAEAGFASVVAYEVSGIMSTSPVELGANASNGATSGGNCTGPSVTTSFTDFLIAQGDADNGYTGASAPWIFGAGQQEAYILGAAPGTYQPVFQAGSGSTKCLESLAAFKMGSASFTVIAPPPPPSITSYSPSTGPVGTSVTVTGTNFGSTQSTSTVTFNGTAATPTSWSATSIVVPAPSGATTGNIVVTVSGVSTTGTHTFTVVAPPSISGMSPTSGFAGTSVTITGSNFGSTGTVTFNSTAASVSSWNSTSIVASVPSGASTGNVVVTANGVSSSGTHTFTVMASPTISGMSPNQGGVGNAVTISGSNLGTSGTVTFNGVSVSAWSWSSSAIIVPVPVGASTGSVVVTIAGVPIPAGSFTVNSSIPSTAIEYSYDSMGRVAQTLICTPMNCGTGQGINITYSYDVGGDLTTLSSYGTTIQYSPTDGPIDAAGRVTKVESGWADGGPHPAVLATVDPNNGYWPTGQVHKITYGNNLTETAVYNSRMQPCRLSVNSSGGLLGNCGDAIASGNVQDYGLNYHPGQNGQNLNNNPGVNNGNVAGFTATGTQSFNRSYSYDSLNRLQTMSAPGDVCSGLQWTIDAWGNRTAQTATSGTCFQPQVSVDGNNHLVGSPYQYDASGNLLSDGNHTYTYDAENRITQVDGGATATYVYNGLGQRVAKIAPGSDEEYLYDASGQINTVFHNDFFERMYVYLNGKQLAEYYNNTTYFPMTDQLGSTRLLLAMDQSVPEKDDYYPYGEPITAGTDSILKFTGKERDNESGLDNFGTRYYTSSLGRFVTPDEPLVWWNQSNPQSLNLFAYALNNPTSNTDDGHDCVYLNDAGNGVESVDQDSSSGECGGTGGYWVQGAVTGAEISGDSLELTGTTNGVDNNTSANYLTNGDTPLNPFAQQALGLAGQMAAPGVNLAAKGLMAFGWMYSGPAMALATCLSKGPGCNGLSVAMAVLPEVAALQEGGVLVRAGRGLHAAEIIEKAGGFEQATKDFATLQGAEKTIGDVKVKELSDGTKAVLRDFSKDGRPTLEIQLPSGEVTKYRYN